MGKSVTVILHDGQIMFEKSKSYLKSISIDIPRNYFEKPHCMNMFLIKREIENGLHQYFPKYGELEPSRIERTTEKITFHFELRKPIQITSLEAINNIHVDVEVPLMFSISRIGISDSSWVIRLNLDIQEDGEVIYQQYLHDKYGHF